MEGFFLEFIQPYVRYATKSNYFIYDTVQTPDCRLLYILSGKGSFDTSDAEIPLTAGTLLYYPPGCIYRIFSDPRSPLNFYTVNFDFTQEFLQFNRPITPVSPMLFDEKSLLPTHLKTEEAAFLKPFAVRDATTVKPDLDALLLEKEARVPLSEQLCSGYLQLILCKLLRLHKNTSPDETAFMHVLSYIRAHFKEQINNKSIAEALNYHPNYLSAVVKETTGMPLHSYITDFRLHQAAGLLASTRLSVSEIAEACGFVNANHFSALFKKHMHLSPLKYRNKT